MKKRKASGSKSLKKSQPKSKTKSVTKSKSKNEKVEQGKDNGHGQDQAVAVFEQPAPEYNVKIDGNKYKVRVHKNYEIEVQSELGKRIKNWIVLLLKKQKLKPGKISKVAQFTYYPTFQFQLAGQKPDHQKCSICQFQFQNLSYDALQKQLSTHNQTDLVTLKCSHIMHYQCLKQLVKDKEWVRCPVCSSIYGKMTGDQPPGQMTTNVNNLTHCEGYMDCGTITINYNMYAGKRGNISFPGTHRVAYLPDNKQGREVLALLQEAFERKLIFTIGRSVTTGRDNQIVWNGIHHKTNLSGGSAYFGYPDATYFDRVKLELAAKGVV